MGLPSYPTYPPIRSIISTTSLCLLAFSIRTAHHDSGRLSTRTAISNVRKRNQGHRRLGRCSFIWFSDSVDPIERSVSSFCQEKCHEAHESPNQKNRDDINVFGQA